VSQNDAVGEGRVMRLREEIQRNILTLTLIA